jgi:hypothetical protein
MPPITRAGLFHASKIWIDDAHGGAARCRRVALRQRRVAAIVIVGPPPLVNMQANRISRIVRLRPNRCRRQNRRNRQNRQSRNAHQSLLRDIRAESPTKRDAIPHQSAPDAGRQGQRAPMALPIIVTAIVPTPYNQRTDGPRCGLHHLSTSTPRPRTSSPSQRSRRCLT